ncbi:MAG: nuclear transport factor 2 family protein [Gammaproteobacteria bacterium]
MEEKYQDLVLQYAHLIDTKNFVGLHEILWEDFTMTGAFTLTGADNFIASLDQLNNFESTMHRVSNIQILDSNANLMHGSCYCIASHIGKNDQGSYILDMGIIYKDVAEARDGKIKLLERNFSMLWQEQRSL